MKTIDQEIAELNRRVKELEAHVPIPATVPAKPPKKFCNQAESPKYIANFINGSVNLGTRKNVFTKKQALEELQERSRKTGHPIVFVGWESYADFEAVGTSNAVLLVEELFATAAGGTSNQIRTWDFEGDLPSGLLWGGLNS